MKFVPKKENKVAEHVNFTTVITKLIILISFNFKNSRIRKSLTLVALALTLSSLVAKNIC